MLHWESDNLICVLWDESNNSTRVPIQLANERAVVDCISKGEGFLERTYSAPGAVMFLLKKKFGLLAQILCIG
jgi:hypothetical protein